MFRIRVFYSKTKHMRFTGNLDLYRTWERLIRRARLPLAYTQGFNPHPKLNLSPALPLGFTSACELIDIWLEEDLPLQEVEEKLREAAPPGIKIDDIRVVDLGEPAIQNQVRTAVYVIRMLEPITDLELKVQQLLEADSLPRVRRGKPYDLRPLIESITIDSNQLPIQVVARLACREGATGRPEEVLAEIGFPTHLAQIHRQEFLWLAAETAEASAGEKTRAA